MPDAQLPLTFDTAPGSPPGPVPHLRDEIARVWGLPLGERVEITFRPGFPLASLLGVLEVRASPDMPWHPRQALALRVTSQDFTSRDIDHWKAL